LQNSSAGASGSDSADHLFGFFERLKTMSSIQRFGTLPMIQNESVASHSYNVAIMSLMIADYEPELKANPEIILRKALFHDFEETILSDIPHPIKHRFKGGKLGQLLEEIVPSLVQNEIFKELPETLRDRYAKITITSKEGLEGGMVAAADAMDIVLTALRELKMGNKYFEHIFKVGLRILERFHHFRFAKLFAESASRYYERDELASAQPTFTDEFMDGAGRLGDIGMNPI
jgi:5'-deoxynucleotidase YfbR-like HD superfamily hydrolase